jgi:predicted nuclease of predicted toxin-antitoxin system
VDSGGGVKLLLDENISRRLLPVLGPAFPGSTRVSLEGLQQASDIEVWQFAKLHDFVVVTKDDDFTALSSLHGRPPCLIKLSVGNCDNDQVAQILLSRRDQIEDQFVDPSVSMVELIRQVP